MKNSMFIIAINLEYICAFVDGFNNILTPFIKKVIEEA